MSSTENYKSKKKFAPQLILIASLMLAGMTTYETLKQIIIPNISIWESHIITIIFSALCATVAGYFIIRKHHELTEELIVKNVESEGLRKELEENVKRLEITISEIKTLTGLLPICSSCKKIRDDKGNWTQIEKYISERSEVDFSHSLCEECIKKLYPDLLDIINKK
jgi:hypothetical protein